MFSHRNVIIPVPENDKEFEKFCEALFDRELAELSTCLNGPEWEGQDGVDILGRSRENRGWIGIQCKKIDPTAKHNELTPSQIREEVGKALAFKPSLSRYIIAITGIIGKDSWREARTITDRHVCNGLFSVELMDWKRLMRRATVHSDFLDQWYPHIALGNSKRRKSRWGWVVGAAAIAVGATLLWPDPDSELSRAIYVIRAARVGTTPPGFATAVETVRKSQFSLSGEALDGLWAPCQNLSGLDLRRVSAESIHATQADFSGSQLFSARFVGGEMNMAKFKNSNLHMARFDHTNMLGATFVGADARFSSFLATTMSGTNLSRSLFHDADLSGADLMAAEIRDADLSNAKMEGVNTLDANLSGTDLRGAKGLTQEMIDRACAQPENPPKLDHGLSLPSRTCFTDETSRRERAVKRAVIAITGVLAVQQGYCERDKLVIRPPDVDGKKGIQIPVDIDE